MNELLVWMLIVVNGAAGVSSSTYPTKELCEDALSIASTGMTVIEKQEYDRKVAEADAKYAAEWAEKHPPRAPKDDNERQLCKDGGMERGSISLTIMKVCKDNLISEVPYRGGIIFGSNSPEREIKYAKCVMAESEPKVRAHR